MAIAIPSSEEEYAALSWLELARLSDQCSKDGATGYDGLLGYMKPIEVEGVGIVQVKLIGLCHDTFTDGSTAGITFQLQDGLSTSKPVSMQMNASAITTGGWRDSVMRNTNMPSLLAALPSTLRSLIKKVTKKSSTSESGTDVVETEDDLFLLSLIESIGTNTTAYTDNPITSSTYMVNEGSQYEYYKQFDSSETEALNHHIIKEDTGSARRWWLRSIYWNYSTGFYLMSASGDWDTSSSSYSCLPAAAFCIAPPPPPPPLYLSGDWRGENNDQPQTVEWIEPDTEHNFYDETGQWSRIESGPVVHSITYMVGGTGKLNHDAAWTGRNAVVPSSAETGSEVIVKDHYQNSGGEEYLGWKEDGVEVSSQTELNDVVKAKAAPTTYTFTMPDSDVTVWYWCEGGFHTV